MTDWRDDPRSFVLAPPGTRVNDAVPYPAMTVALPVLHPPGDPMPHYFRKVVQGASEAQLADSALVAAHLDGMEPPMLCAQYEVTDGTVTSCCTCHVPVVEDGYVTGMRPAHELEVVPGSGRAGAPRTIPSSRALGHGRTFACPHMSVGNAVSASCGTCGPLAPVA